MYPESVASLRAESLSEAAALLREHGPRARLLAGGQSLVPLMKLRLAVPEVLIDVSHLAPDEPIAFEPETVRVHALATHSEVGAHAKLTSAFDVIADAIPQLADPQVRNMGTVGGALAEADPSGDWGPLVLATGSVIHAVSPDGSRKIPASELFTGPFETVLESDEVITRIDFPRPPSNSGGAYLKVKRRQGVYAVAAIGVQLEVNDAGECVSIDVACNAVEPTYVSPDLEPIFVGKRIDANRIAAGAERFADELDPISDNHGSAAYKRNLCTKLFERAVSAAYDRARGRSVELDPMGAT